VRSAARCLGSHFQSSPPLSRARFLGQLPKVTGFCVGPSSKLMKDALDVGILPLYDGPIDEQEAVIPAVSDD
jgi:hypothetical protein